MGTIVDYALEAVESFEERPFGAVDSLVLSQLSYLNYNGLAPGPEEGFRPFRELTEEAAVASLLQGDRVPELNGELVRRIGANPRFREMRIGNFVDIIDKEAQEQFSAVTFLLDGGAYVAYRGTDSTYVGWKEDFNLAFICPVPSQVAGAEYLTWTAGHVDGPLRVGGHSKGGNIAVYSSLFCSPEARDRIKAVYSHDGPGFTEGVLESQEFFEMRDRLHKTIPQSSLVGVLLQNQENYRVVESSQFWILQHDPFSWIVEQGDFRYQEELNYGARFLDRSLNAWISSLSKEELSQFADALYRVLCTLPGDSFSDAPDKWWEAAWETLNGLKGLDQETYACILRTVRSLFTLSLKNLSRLGAGIPLPEVHLPEIPAPKRKLRELPQPLSEEFLRKLPFLQKEPGASAAHRINPFAKESSSHEKTTPAS